MAAEAHRVVSVGERTSWNRMARLVASAARDLDIDWDVAIELGKQIANLARDEGLVLTAQVARRPDC